VYAQDQRSGKQHNRWGNPSSGMSIERCSAVTQKKGARYDQRAIASFIVQGYAHPVKPVRVLLLECGIPSVIVRQAKP